MRRPVIVSGAISNQWSRRLLGAWSAPEHDHLTVEDVVHRQPHRAVLPDETEPALTALPEQVPGTPAR